MSNKKPGLSLEKRREREKGRERGAVKLSRGRESEEINSLRENQRERERERVKKRVQSFRNRQSCKLQRDWQQHLHLNEYTRMSPDMCVTELVCKSGCAL